MNAQRARARARASPPLGLLTRPSSSDAPPAFLSGCDLELTQKTTGAENGLSDEVVWVSALFDLKRGEAGNGEFHRPMEEYYRRFQIVLDRGFKMVIFIPQVRVAPAALQADPEPRAHRYPHPRPAPHPRRPPPRARAQHFEPHLKIDYARVKVIYMNMTDLQAYFPYWDRIQSIRLSQLWQSQAEAAGWLKNAPQARLEGYNPLVMAKPFLLRDAARVNPWGARYHMWMDAGHLCAGGQSPHRQDMYRRHMSRGFFNTHWPYATNTEVRRAARVLRGRGVGLTHPTLPPPPPPHPARRCTA
jgi:hypothetical protein